MRKFITVILLIAVVGAAGGYFYLKNKGVKITITQEQIDEALEKQFPIEKDYLKVFTVSYENPTVLLIEDSNRVQVGLDATANMRFQGEGKNLGGSAVATTAIKYDSETQEFYLTDARLVSLEFVGVPDKVEEEVSGIVPGLLELSGVEIQGFDNEALMGPLKEKAAESIVEYLNRKPIYRIEAKDKKTAAAKLLLQELEVKDQKVVVTLGLK